MAVGVSGLHGPSAASRVATEELCSGEGPVQHQHRLTVERLATETPDRRTGAAKDPVVSIIINITTPNRTCYP